MKKVCLHSAKDLHKDLKTPISGSSCRCLFFSHQKRMKPWYKTVCTLQHINVLIFSSRVSEQEENLWKRNSQCPENNLKCQLSIFALQKCL